MILTYTLVILGLLLFAFVTDPEMDASRYNGVPYDDDERPEIGSEAWVRDQIARKLDPTQEIDRPRG